MCFLLKFPFKNKYGLTYFDLQLPIEMAKNIRILIYVSEKYLLEIIAISILFIALKEIIGPKQAFLKNAQEYI